MNFLRQYKYTLAAALGAAILFAYVLWHNKQDAQECEAKGGRLIGGEYGYECVRLENIL